MHHARVFGRPTTEVNDARALVDRVLDRLSNAESIADAVGREGTNRHEFGVRSDQRYQSGYKSAVPGNAALSLAPNLHRVVVVIDEVPAIRVINQSVVVIVDTVAR